MSVQSNFDNAATQPHRPLRRAEASAYLFQKYGIERKPSTLAKLACVGGGPVFRLAGRWPLYAPADLDTWAESITTGPKASTSDQGEAA